MPSDISVMQDPCEVASHKVTLDNKTRESSTEIIWPRRETDLHVNSIQPLTCPMTLDTISSQSFSFPNCTTQALNDTRFTVPTI